MDLFWYFFLTCIKGYYFLTAEVEMEALVKQQYGRDVQITLVSLLSILHFKIFNEIRLKCTIA